MTHLSKLAANRLRVDAAPASRAGRALQQLFAEGSVGPSATNFVSAILAIEAESFAAGAETTCESHRLTPRCDFDCGQLGTAE